jgi:hypothetical protein
VLVFLLLALLGLLSHWTPLAASIENTPIFQAGRTFTYRATLVSPQGDTLSRERVTITPTGQPWKYQKKTQLGVVVRYAYSRQDSLRFLTYPNPLTKKSTEPKPYSWVRSLETGAIESPQQVWMHPLRSNQYVSTEIAPHPQVKLDSLALGGVWHNKTVILMGWGAFNGKTSSQYHVVKRETKRYGTLVAADCWFIQAQSQHSQLGTSYLDFYFHPNYGFVELNYRCFDGTRISFVLTQITNPS